ncbi:MAG: hypothetical protein B7Z60_09715 [Ferrovum sp. 37-45-19]|uniref:GtrA family protein n=1 Tax=Ferrovum sp. JA12 TaxID=1356299 RepID=UPI000703B01A|nr:GtrA family protein [Ferrovum sp. JA12]OYV78583.1 MAG: hypothetical protein B7Z65_09620 [Ferrovum sp. 21-44-67]OYV93109.1 MAG: hypothetical protein B7Z60_09715 [Ferrovum sp. 37-45-19]OZB32988.1 MAG: hypothetical protein B7X47_05375 [Ferrovum sp. 34-44-207]HQT81742.1 GtrA family protein [Ferrovaceae bacterium]KRH79570.1 GtrA-like protein [Ferrovum sp. JA12]
MRVQQLANRHYLFFILAGSCGFVVDAGVVTVLHKWCGAGLISAKVISFFLAVTVTWWINRTYTFRKTLEKNLFLEWIHYFSANIIGAIINNGLYVFLVILFAFPKEYPVVAVAAGSLGGMVFNYFASKTWVFK